MPLKYAFYFSLLATLCAIAALLVQVWLPSTSEPIALFSVLFVLTLLGPLLFAWSWGPGPLTAVAAIAAFATPIAVACLAYLGFTRRVAPAAWLTLSALLWCGFGGFSAFLAVSGSV